ncbi:MAG: hypothetical protein CMJ15_06015 [Pelagibacterium sp.]|uniref:hypothetical protein n=1 Tax=uncultured Pelagibacterium sp. TaxID=1159875 RepID=UPI000C60E7C4|nr:hypothetical protein [Pelagibacterium sp.]|tara:strand:+ start:307 stop:498 length:192 start_codon:yes stop_codon:yes gene_type:complete
MLIRHSPEILLHRMARIGAGSLEATAALIARERGAMMIEKTIARLDAPVGAEAEATHQIDKSA